MKQRWIYFCLHSQPTFQVGLSNVYTRCYRQQVDFVWRNPSEFERRIDFFFRESSCCRAGWCSTCLPPAPLIVALWLHGGWAPIAIARLEASRAYEDPVAVARSVATWPMLSYEQHLLFVSCPCTLATSPSIYEPSREHLKFAHKPDTG